MAKPGEPSEIIGGYVLERVLGRGGMGTVYLGKHRLLGRAAAVKVLDNEMAGNEQLVSRFFHEAKIVNDVRHPNIVDVIDFVRTENPRRVAFIMEYLDGESLDRFLKEKGPLSVSQAINVVLQILDGLAAVHAIGAIHRDLKPANLRFTNKQIGDCSAVPIVKILDFGIAKASAPVASHKTQTGIVLGTPAYMAPEQVSGEAVSSASDIYAVGEILYELLGGRRLFTGTNTQVLRAKLATQPPEIDLAEELPYREELCALVRACVMFEPAHRPTTDTLIAELQDLRPRVSASAVPHDFEDAAKPTTVVPSPAPTPAPVRTPAPMNTLAGDRSLYGEPKADWRRYLLPIIGVGLVTGAAATLLVVMQQERPILARPLEPAPLEEPVVRRIEPPPPAPPPAPPPVVAIAEDEVKPKVETKAKEKKKERKPKKEARRAARPPPPPPARPPPPPPPAETTPEAKYGRIKLTAWTTAGRQVPATVKIDGRAVARTAPLEIKARAGKRKVEVEAVGHPPKVQEVEVEDGETTNVDVVVDSEMIAILLCLALAARPDPQGELTQGIVAFGRGDLKAARKHLDSAESHTTDSSLLARIHRQRGIIDQVEGNRLRAVVSFVRALYFDPKLELSDREHKGEVQQLFACAKELNKAGLSERAVEVRHAKDFENADWQCPMGQKPPPVEPPPPPPPPIALPPPAPAEKTEESGSIWTSPWLWIAVGAVVVAGGATTAGILLANGEEPYGGTTGVNIRLER